MDIRSSSDAFHCRPMVFNILSILVVGNVARNSTPTNRPQSISTMNSIVQRDESMNIKVLSPKNTIKPLPLKHNLLPLVMTPMNGV